MKTKFHKKTLLYVFQISTFYYKTFCRTDLYFSYAPKNTNPPIPIHMTRGCIPVNHNRIIPFVPFCPVVAPSINQKCTKQERRGKEEESNKQRRELEMSESYIE